MPPGSVRAKASLLRRALIEIGREYKCVECDNPGKWRDKDLVLDVHHRDENWQNNLPNNLDFICPNCHRILKE